MSKGKGERLRCQVGRVQSSKSKVVSQRFESGWDPCNDEAQEKSPASNPIAMTTMTMIPMSPLIGLPIDPFPSLAISGRRWYCGDLVEWLRAAFFG